MKLTTRGQYAIRALKFMRANEIDGRPMTLETVSRSKEISLHYLEQLFRKLRTAGIVKSYRGPGGGYAILERPVGQWTYLDVFEAVGEKVEVSGFPEIEAQVQNLFQSQTL